MKLIFSEQAWEDYLYWQKTDRKVLARINTLIQDIQHFQSSLDARQVDGGRAVRLRPMALAE